MTAKSRYWDHERCAWVAYESAALPTAADTPELSAEPVPDQRVDEATGAPATSTAGS
jgi:hypothetical protein